jgi:hypothetical protein
MPFDDRRYGYRFPSTAKLPGSFDISEIPPVVKYRMSIHPLLLYPPGRDVLGPIVTQRPMTSTSSREIDRHS